MTGNDEGDGFLTGGGEEAMKSMNLTFASSEITFIARISCECIAGSPGSPTAFSVSRSSSMEVRRANSHTLSCGRNCDHTQFRRCQGNMVHTTTFLLEIKQSRSAAAFIGKWRGNNRKMTGGEAL